MLYRTMQSTGDKLSILGFGCMRFPMKRGKVDRKKADALMSRALEGGINYFDTAMPYHMGESELVLGDFLAQGHRRDVFLATKMPINRIRAPEHMENVFNKQLERLKTDYVDYYLLHGVKLDKEWDRLSSLGVASFLDRAVASGKVRHAGFSFHGGIELFKRIVDSYDWKLCYIQYSFLDEELQAGAEGLRYAADKGMGIIVMEPLRGGVLGNNPPPPVRRVWDQAKPRRDPAEWALRWVWNHPEISCVLSGMTFPEHLEANLRTADTALPSSLSADDLALISRVKDVIRQSLEVDCTGCRYCVPCPEGVNIPDCFDWYNRATFFKQGLAPSTIMYATFLGAAAPKEEQQLASKCTECGACIPRCPQKIQIPDKLKRVSSTLEGPIFKVVRLVLRTQVKAKAVQQKVAGLLSRFIGPRT